MKYEPDLHKPVPMNARVIVPAYAGGGTGTVVGISSYHMIFSYIVLLDNPIEKEDGPHQAFAVHGTDLVGVDGSDWKLDG